MSGLGRGRGESRLDRRGGRKRSRVSSRQFALPGRRYPVHDRRHAIAAKQRASQQYRRGRLSARQKRRVFAAANRKLRRMRG